MHQLFLAAAPYKNTIAGEVVTVAVCATMAVIGVAIALRNFVQHKPTGGE